MDFCCDLRCFEAPRCQVDGMACRICRSFCYCRCRCKSVNNTIYVYNDDNKIYTSFLENKNIKEIASFKNDENAVKKLMLIFNNSINGK